MAQHVNGGMSSIQEETNVGVQQNASASQVSTTTQEPTPSSYANAMIATPTIVNQTVPLVVFVGPPASGKSMILVRMAQYLFAHGYTIQTDPTFLNTAKYQRDCEEFARKLHTNIALDGTAEFILVDIYKNGNLIAKMLEAPGEDFFATDPEKAAKNNIVAPYLATIMTSNNPKTYVMLLDLDSKVSFRNNSSLRAAYAQRLLTQFYPRINQNRDQIVLLYNKIDATMFGTINGCQNPSGARKDAEMYYAPLFSGMQIEKLAGFLKVDNFEFKTFCTGMYADQVDNMGNPYQTYNVASDTYPEDLWKDITRKW